MMSPSFNTAGLLYLPPASTTISSLVAGIPWQTTWLIEVHTDLGKPW